LSTKLSAGVGAQVDLRVGMCAALGLLIGVTVGGALAGRINPTHARVVAVTLVYLGALATVIHALITLQSTNASGDKADVLQSLK
jgi:uncharacterized membrane protein YfcA